MERKTAVLSRLVALRRFAVSKILNEVMVAAKQIVGVKASKAENGHGFQARLPGIFKKQPEGQRAWSSMN